MGAAGRRLETHSPHTFPHQAGWFIYCSTEQLNTEFKVSLELLKTEITLHRAACKSFWKLNDTALLKTLTAVRTNSQLRTMAHNGRPSPLGPALPTALPPSATTTPSPALPRLQAHPFRPCQVPTHLSAFVLVIPQMAEGMTHFCHYSGLSSNVPSSEKASLKLPHLKWHPLYHTVLFSFFLFRAWSYLKLSSVISRWRPCRYSGFWTDEWN